MEMKPAKILLADDSALMHKLLRAVLPGVSVVDALDGWEALSRLGEHPDVDLMVVDVNMPRMDGVELVQRLKADGALASIRVLVMTTQCREHDAITCLRAGAAAYLRKPFQPREMLDIVERM
jgi:CheY-like chemotaxis protein